MDLRCKVITRPYTCTDSITDFESYIGFTNITIDYTRNLSK